MKSWPVGRSPDGGLDGMVGRGRVVGAGRKRLRTSSSDRVGVKRVGGFAVNLSVAGQQDRTYSLARKIMITWESAVNKALFSTRLFP